MDIGLGNPRCNDSPDVIGRAATIRDDEPDSSYLALGASPEYAPVGTFVNQLGLYRVRHARLRRIGC